MENSKKQREKLEEDLKAKNSPPITELPNRLTTNIDLCTSGREIVELLAQTDQEIFDGWQSADSLESEGLKNDRLILDKLGRLSDLIAERIANAGFRLIISGCGTSGRIAYLCSRTFNALVGRRVCEHIIAGGDWALVNSVESVEDKPDIGRQELLRLGQLTIYKLNSHF